MTNQLRSKNYFSYFEYWKCVHEFCVNTNFTRKILRTRNSTQVGKVEKTQISLVQKTFCSMGFSHLIADYSYNLSLCAIRWICIEKSDINKYSVTLWQITKSLVEFIVSLMTFIVRNSYVCECILCFLH